MDLDGVTFKPADRTLAVKFLDDDDGDDDTPGQGSYPPQPDSDDNEGVLATVIAVGAKTTIAKKGQIVVVAKGTRRWALCVGEVCLVDEYNIRAVLTSA